MISRSRRSILLRTSPNVRQHAPLLTVGLPHSAGLSVVGSSAKAGPASKHHKRAEAGLTRMVVSFSQASTQNSECYPEVRSGARFGLKSDITALSEKCHEADSRTAASCRKGQRLFASLAQGYGLRQHS